jgi:hypothetical protein
VIWLLLALSILNLLGWTWLADKRTQDRRADAEATKHRDYLVYRLQQDMTEMRGSSTILWSLPTNIAERNAQLEAERAQVKL